MNKKIVSLGAGAVLAALSAVSFGHGFVDSPGSRNYFCGKITKPDHSFGNNAQYKQCADAFANDFNGGYSYMSVLNHHGGRKELGPIAKNVCSFDSETWNGATTPWDAAIDWPVNNINSGTQVFSWDISYGPHFDDTSDFRYWITKPGFVYQVGKPLTWADFEDQPFCDLNYNDDNPGASPNVRADRASTRFHTTCTVPARTGRHVIYAEWGREPPTYERFHGCIDVQIGGGGSNPPPASSSRPSSSAAVSSVRSSSSVAVSSVRPSSSSAAVSSVRSSSSVAVSSVRPSSSSVAPSSSSAAAGTGGTCNWYGWNVRICSNLSSGWGNEGNETCISRAACDAK